MDKRTQPYFEIVEGALKKLGVEPTDARGENQGQWNLKRGTATVWIDLWKIDEEKGTYFQTISPVMTLPGSKEKKDQLFEELLRINYQLFGMAFTVHEDGIYLKSIREVEGLDESEVIHMIGRCGNYSDHYNDKLVKKFGGRRIE